MPALPAKGMLDEGGCDHAGNACGGPFSGQDEEAAAPRGGPARDLGHPLHDPHRRRRGGNVYCLGLTGDDENGVYFHDHSVGWHDGARRYEELGEDVPADIRYRTVYPIADSFEGFVEGMSR